MRFEASGLLLHAADDRRVCLSVSDDGPGLPPDFDWEKSRSLGLKMIRSLSRQIRGEILVKQQSRGPKHARARLRHRTVRIRRETLREHDLMAAIETASHRHRAEQRLQKMERWLATTLQSIGDGVISVDLDGRVTFLNAKAEEITGWS